jgi:propionyl-CoA carboxylase alpha chain
LREVVTSPRFVSGNISTKFLAEQYPTGFKGHKLGSENLKELIATSAVIHLARHLQIMGDNAYDADSSPKKDYIIIVNEKSYPVNVAITEEDAKVSREKYLFTSNERKMISFQVVFEDGTSMSLLVDWPLESSLINSLVKDGRRCIIQYLEKFPNGYRLQYFGTRVKLIIWIEE